MLNQRAIKITAKYLHENIIKKHIKIYSVHNIFNIYYTYGLWYFSYFMFVDENKIFFIKYKKKYIN